MCLVRGILIILGLGSSIALELSKAILATLTGMRQKRAIKYSGTPNKSSYIISRFSGKSSGPG